MNKMRANKSLGQHFLQDKSILQRIADMALDKVPVVEIGAGRGELTSFLAQRNKVLAIEKDRRFKNFLRIIPNVHVLMADIREVDLEEAIKKLDWRNFQLFGNLPFCLEKPILQKVATLRVRPQKAVFLINKEVAEQFGERKSLFALSIEFWAKVRVAFLVPKTAFVPPPKVDGAVIEMNQFGFVLPFGLKRREIYDDFLRLLKHGFSSPRKKLINNLAGGLRIEKCVLQKIFRSAKIDLNSRAENLQLEDWLRLWLSLKDGQIEI